MYTLFYRVPRLTILAILVAVAGGIGAILTLGRQEDPTLVERYGFVLTALPGADAERIEALVTDPVETALLELSEIDQLVSSSREGVSQVSVTMRDDLSVAEVDDAWTLIRAQVESARAEFPDGTLPPIVDRQYVGAATLIVALTWEGAGPAPLPVMTRMAQELEDRLKTLPGTEEVRSHGMPTEEIQVRIDGEALATAGLSTRQAASLIAAADSKTPAGAIRQNGSSLGLDVAGEFQSISRIRSVPLLQLENGSSVRVGDVADVTIGIEDPVSVKQFINNQRAILVSAAIQEGLQVDQWASSAQAVVDRFAADAPGELTIETVFDQSDYTVARLGELSRNLLVSALIVMVVLFLTMGWRSALVVGMALPLTVLLVLILFRVFGMPLHQMSVTGLVIALGLLIDNAIVVVDEFDQYRGKGMARLEAMQSSLSHLFGPLFASTLTTALAFAPIAMLPGGAGEFVGMIGVSVIFAVCSSLLIAMTVIPAMAGWFDRKRAGESATAATRRWWRDGIVSNTISDGYRATVEAVLRFPPLGLALGIAPAAIGFILAGSLPSQFFPSTERDMFQVEMVLPASASIEETERQVRAATDFILAREDVVSVNFTLGEPSPRVYYNAFANTRGVEGFASGWVQTTGAAATRSMVSDIQREVRDAFPDVQFLAVPYAQGPPTDAPLQLFIEGNDLETLNRLGNELRAVMAQTPGVTYTSASLQLGSPRLTLEADEALSAITGERFSDLAADLAAELNGVEAGSVLEGSENIPVRVIAPPSERGSLEDLRGMGIGGLAGGDFGTPVGALGEITLKPSVARVERKDARRVNDIRGFVEPYTLPAPVFADFQARLDASGFELPTGYRILVGGDAEASGNAQSNLAATAIPLLLIMLGAVALVFNSFRMAFLILSVGTLCIGLAFFGVWLFNLPLGFNAIIGALGLLGIAINGSIVVLSMLRSNEACMGDDIIAQRETVVDATRHIVATTLTTMGGFVPILLAGDVFWMPLAAAIFGGVAGSAILALYFTPAVFRITTMRPISRLLSRAGSTDKGFQPAE
ncbi:MAG: efflux RND transporter permease subunit [Pseudomonadota bacterium]